MKKVITYTLALFIALSGASAFAVQKVPKKSKNDSTKIKAAEKPDNKLPVKKQPAEDIKPQQPVTKQPEIIKQPVSKPPQVAPVPKKDSFIDRDGDGINDNIKKRKAPEIIKERPPRVVKEKPSKPVIKKDTEKKQSKKRSKK